MASQWEKHTSGLDSVGLGGVVSNGTAEFVFGHSQDLAQGHLLSLGDFSQSLGEGCFFAVSYSMKY